MTGAFAMANAVSGALAVRGATVLASDERGCIGTKSRGAGREDRVVTSAIRFVGPEIIGPELIGADLILESMDCGVACGLAVVGSIPRTELLSLTGDCDIRIEAGVGICGVEIGIAGVEVVGVEIGINEGAGDVRGWMLKAELTGRAGLRTAQGIGCSDESFDNDDDTA